MSDRVLALRQAADEIAKAGHNGWGNVCLDGADEIERLKAELRDIALALGWRWQVGENQDESCLTFLHEMRIKLND